MPSESHAHRSMAESFGTDAARYDRTRPRYPDALIDAIVAASPGPAVLDVGCGTGIVGTALRSRGCRVLGVEPDPRMAAFARERGLDVEVARLEDWEPADRRVDAVVAGQTWHWVDPVAGAAAAARVLRPGGVLAVFWTVISAPPTVAAATTEVVARLVPDAPVPPAVADPVATYGGMVDRAAEGLAQAGGFDHPERWRHDRELTYTRDEWLDQLPTHGPLTRLAPDVLDRVLAGTGAAIDALGGSFTVAAPTLTMAARRS